jgi:lysophospholipase L1-like esterase
MIIPYRDITAFDPVDEINAASIGAGHIEGKCVAGQNGVDEMDPSDDITTVTQEYGDQPFTVSGGSYEFHMSSSKADSGTAVFLKSMDACDGTEVHGALVSNQGVSNFMVYPDGSGNWTASVPVSSYDDMSEITTPFPAGNYAAYAFCTGGGQDAFYGEKVLEVTEPGNYVALGDSFSSGEGVAPFDSDTDITDIDECHRSDNAYAHYLADYTLLGLDLGSSGFGACSGATTNEITSPNYGNAEPAQIDRITTNTELITMTIGGNDMGFPSYARACVDPTVNPLFADCSGDLHDDMIANIVNDVIPNTQSMLEAVDARLTELGIPDARVLVIGYPQIVAHDLGGFSGNCAWLNGQTEADDIRDVVTHLNTAVKNEVDAMDDNFQFISLTGANDTFDELCNDYQDLDNDPADFIYPILSPEEEQRYSFHPQVTAHVKIGEIIEDYLINNPL